MMNGGPDLRIKNLEVRVDRADDTIERLRQALEDTPWRLGERVSELEKQVMWLHKLVDGLQKRMPKRKKKVK